MTTQECPVCESRISELGRGQVLGHIAVTYYCCTSCGLVSLPDPGWLDEAYSNPIALGDIGLLRRCQLLTKVTSAIVRTEGLSHGRFLDWAGGYGTLCRLLRDVGLDFEHWDPHCKNLFAVGHEGDPTKSYDLVTAYEVIEHLPSPVESLREIAEQTDRLLFTTFLLPEPAPPPGTWWYYSPDSGQHVTFHTTRSLELLGQRLGYQLISNGEQLHMFHRGGVNLRTRVILSRTVLTARKRARSLMTRVRGLRGSTAPRSRLDYTADGEASLR